MVLFSRFIGVDCIIPPQSTERLPQPRPAAAERSHSQRKLSIQKGSEDGLRPRCVAFAGGNALSRAVTFEPGESEAVLVTRTDVSRQSVSPGC